MQLTVHTRSRGGQTRRASTGSVFPSQFINPCPADLRGMLQHIPPREEGGRCPAGQRPVGHGVRRVYALAGFIESSDL